MKRPLMIWVAILLTLAFALLAAAIAVNNLCFTAACESDNSNDGLFIATFTALAAGYSSPGSIYKTTARFLAGTTGSLHCNFSHCQIFC